MSLNIFLSEVCKALNKTRGLYSRWSESQVNNPISTPGISPGILIPPVSKEELEWTTTELRNALRSIEWDLEDLEDTIYILFKTNFYIYILNNQKERKHKYYLDYKNTYCRKKPIKI